MSKPNLATLSLTDLFDDQPTADSQPQQDANPAPDPAPAPVADLPPAPTTPAPEPVAADTPVSTPADAPDEPGIIDSLNSILGYQVEGEFSEDYDGLAKYTRAVAEKMIAAERETEDTELPDVAEYREFRRNGGRPYDYFGAQAPDVDYAKLEIGDNNVLVQKQIVTTLLTAQGYSPEDAKATVDAYEDTSLLHKQSLIAKNILANAQTQERQSLLESQRIAAEEQAQANRDNWNQVNQLVTSGNLGTITIPDADKKGFFDWMAMPVDKGGNSQRTIDHQKLSQEQRLQLEYLLYKKLDLEKFAQTVRTTQSTNGLRAKLNPTPSAASRTQNAAPGSTRAGHLPSLEEIGFNQ